MEPVCVKPIGGGLSRVLLVTAVVCVLAGLTPLLLHGLALPKDPWSLAAAALIAALLVLWAYQNDSRRLLLRGSQLDFHSFFYGWRCEVSELTAISSEVDMSGGISAITFWRGAENVMKLRYSQWSRAEMDELLRRLQLLNPSAEMSLAILLHLESMYAGDGHFE